jgi:hypothetical protein
VLKGVNVDPWHGFTAHEVRLTLRPQSVRTVMFHNRDMTPWLNECHALSMTVLAIVAAEARGELTPNEQAMYYYTKYGPLVDYWQLGNEWDLVSDSSDTQPPSYINELGSAFRARMPEAKLVLGGSASGLATALNDIDLKLFDAVGVHTYTKQVAGLPKLGHTGQLVDLLDAYAAYKKPLWITEFGGVPAQFENSAIVKDSERTEYYIAQYKALESYGCEAAYAFCYSNLMVKGYGIKEYGTLRARFRELGNMITVGDSIQQELTRRGDYAIKNPEFFSNNDGSSTEHVVGTKGEYWATNTTGSWVVTVVPFG